MLKSWDEDQQGSCKGNEGFYLCDCALVDDDGAEEAPQTCSCSEAAQGRVKSCLVEGVPL